MKMFEGIHHATVVSRDMAKSRAVYQSLGFNKVMFDNQFGPEDAAKMGMPPLYGHAMMLQREGLDTAMVELYQFQNADREPLADGEAPFPYGLALLSFKVADVQSVYDKLSVQGITFLAPPSKLHVPGYGTALVAIGMGPDGVAIELFQDA